MQKAVFAVRVDFLESVLGTVPKNKDLVERWLQEEARKRQEVAPDALQEELGTVPVASVSEMEQSAWDGFHADEEGPFVYDYLVKGHLKEAARALTKGEDVKGLANKLGRSVFVQPRRIHFLRDGGGPIAVPDGFLERPVRIFDRAGQRVALKRSDRIDPPARAEFRVEVIIPSQFADTAGQAEKLLRSLLEYGEYVGWGEWRSGGYGRFAFELSLL